MATFFKLGVKTQLAYVVVCEVKTFICSVIKIKDVYPNRLL